MIHEILNIIENKFFVKSGINKKNELVRLIFEILKKYNITIAQFLDLPPIKDYINKKKFRFQDIKNILLELRYPLTSKNNDLKNYRVYLPPPKISDIKKRYFYSGRFKPTSIYIEKEALHYPLTEKILSRFPDIKPQIIDKLKNFKRNWRDYITTIGKDELFIVKENYDILKPCPCTKNVVCCGYYIFNLGFGCPYDCSYCYLQHYTNFPGIIVPVNIDEILAKLEALLKKAKIPMRRIGTGEFTDSLAIDEITEYTKYIIPFFNNTEYILELKTKSTNIENVLRFKPTRNVVVAWSLNPQKIIDSDEYFTPSLKKRLKAAKKIVEAGFKVGFHFDPVIYYDGWEKDYKETIELMYKYTGNNIVWISIGTLRFHRTLKPIIEMRFPESRILDGELLIHPVDKKMRYPDFIRKEVYLKMLKWIREYDKKVNVYLCMEPYFIWHTVKLKLEKFKV